VIDLHR